MPLRRTILTLALLAAAGLLTAAAHQQADELRVRLVSPAANTFVTGTVVLRAEVSPADAPGLRVSFFVDDEPVGSRREPPWEVAWEAGDEFRRRLIRVEAEDAAGRTAEDSLLTQDLETAVFRAEVQAVLLYVTVVDGRGGLVSGLDRDAFEVREQGVVQPISFFASEPRPMVVGLLLDTSGSMEGVKVQRAKQGALAFLGELGPADQAFVMRFDSFPRLVQDLTPNQRLLREGIQELQVGGATSLNLAVVEGVDILAERPERRALVVLSDGFDTTQTVSERQAVDYARRHDVRVYTIGIFDALRGGMRRGGFGRGFDDVNPGEVALRGFADGTGGRAVILNSLGELVSAYAEIAAELRSQYALAYRPTDPPDPGEWREIEVRVRGGTARTKPGYYGGGQGF